MKVRPKVEERNKRLIEEGARELGVDPGALEILVACDFCGDDIRQVGFLIAGTALMEDIDVHICPACVETCVEIIATRPTTKD